MNGNDRNPGTEHEPFATIARAREAIRERKGRLNEPVVVWVRGGTYYLPEPLVFEPADSGREKSITYAAYPGEPVTLSGGRKLTCQWRPYQDAIMRCELPEVRAGRLDFTQLFINGKRQIRARYPSYDHKNPLVSGNGYINIANKDVPVNGIYYDPQTFTKKRWARPQDAVIHIFDKYYWAHGQWKVENVDWENHVLRFGWGGVQFEVGFSAISDLFGPASRFFVENVFEELDAPGEWYLDKVNGLLYYMPAEGVDLQGAIIEVPVLEQVIEFRGSQLNPVK
jgi:hypothetical protein